MAAKRMHAKFLIAWPVHGHTEDGKRYFSALTDATAFYDEVRYIRDRWSARAFNRAPTASIAYGIDRKSQGHYVYDAQTAKVSPCLSLYERPRLYTYCTHSFRDSLLSKDGVMDLWKQETRILQNPNTEVGTNVSAFFRGCDRSKQGSHPLDLLSLLKTED